MAQNLLRLRRSVVTIHRALSATSSLSSVPRSSSSSAVVHHSPTSQFQFQSRSFRSSSISYARPNSSPGNYNPDEEIGPDTILFEGCDYNHWLIVMDFPRDDKKPPAEEMVRTYEETCARGLNISVEEAKKKIYACSTTTYTGFQVLMSEEESEKFNGLPGVIFVLPDSYIDPQNKEYGGDKYVNGEITHRPPPFKYERQGSRYRDRNRYDRPMPNQQGNSSYGQPGSPQGGGNYTAAQPGSPPQTYGPPGQGVNRGHTSVNSPGGRDAYQPGRDPIPSYQGNYNQRPQRNLPQGDQSTYPPPSQGELRGNERTSGYGQGPSSGSYGQGPIAESYGQGPSGGSAGAYGQGPSAGSYGQAPSGAGSYGQGPSGAGSYGQGPSAGSYGQGPSAGSYGQGPSAGSAGTYGQGPSAGGYGQVPSAGGYGQGPIAGGYGQGPSSGYPSPGDQSFTQGEPRSMQGEQPNYAPMGQTGTDRGRY